MRFSLTAALFAAPPPPGIPLEQPAAGAVALLCLVGSALAALYRRSLQRSVPSRVLEGVASEPRRERLERLLGRVDRLAATTSAWKLVFDLSFVVWTLSVFAGEGTPDSWTMLAALAFCVPLLLLFGEMVPSALAPRVGDRLLRATLPAFHLTQLPFVTAVQILSALSRHGLRLLGIAPSDSTARPILEGLRGVIEESEIDGELGETERQIIGNVMEFHDADVAELMTPRTEVVAVDVEESVHAAVEKLAECGHSRVPLFSGSLDRIVGVLFARDVLHHLAAGAAAPATLSDLMRPPHFVPETKRVSELLEEFRREKLKIAIVLDEYGGTAGVVSMGDVLAELVGDIRDEWEPDEPEAVRETPDGGAEVLASLRVSEVNERLELDLPEEEDFETLAGFVLSELGHFPRAGETFTHEGRDYTVLEASDRRVLRVHVGRAPTRQSA